MRVTAQTQLQSSTKVVIGTRPEAKVDYRLSDHLDRGPSPRQFIQCDSKEIFVANSYWSGWYSGWGRFLWFGIMMLMFSSAGNWVFLPHPS